MAFPQPFWAAGPRAQPISLKNFFPRIWNFSSCCPCPFSVVLSLRRVYVGLLCHCLSRSGVQQLNPAFSFPSPTWTDPDPWASPPASSAQPPGILEVFPGINLLSVRVSTSWFYPRVPVTYELETGWFYVPTVGCKVSLSTEKCPGSPKHHCIAKTVVLSTSGRELLLRWHWLSNGPARAFWCTTPLDISLKSAGTLTDTI